MIGGGFMAYLTYEGLNYYHNSMKEFMSQAIQTAINEFANTRYYICQSDEYDENGVPTVEGEAGVIYLVPRYANSLVGSVKVGTAVVAANVDNINMYYEYIYYNNTFELVGDKQINLDGYLVEDNIATNEQVDAMLSELSLL